MTLPTLYRKGYMLEDKNAVPIEYIINWFQDRLSLSGRDNRIIILLSTTGSGKSTVLPPEFFQKVMSTKLIVCTQPRILNAISIPKQIIPHFENANIPLEMGKNVGFQTSLISQKIRISGIIYMTIGVLYMILSTSLDEDILKKYSCIFIDEAHERSPMIDCCLYLLKEFVERNSTSNNCPFIVIMSATIDTKLFADYFNIKNILHVQGETYPISKTFLAKDSLTLYDDIYEIAMAHHKKDTTPGKYRDILVFLPGISEIDKLKQKFIKAHYTDDFLKNNPLLPVEVTGDSVKKNPYEVLVDIDKLSMYINNKKVKPLRRIFLGTNVAETGITIPSLSVVIEPGYYNSSEFYPNLESKVLYKKPVTRSMALQRCGRVGREAPGDAYLMYTEKTFKSMIEIQHPDIIRDNITEFILNLGVQHIKKFPSLLEMIENYDNKIKLNIFDIDLLTKPPSENVYFAMNKLYYYGAIDLNCNITKLGIIYSKMANMNLEHVRCILMGYVYNVAIIDLINIIISLNFNIPVIEDLPLAFSDDFINGMYYFYVIDKHLLEIPSDILGNREDVCNSLVMAGFNPYHNYNIRFSTQKNKFDYIQKIKQCIYEGFKLNTCRWQNDKYVNRMGNTIVISRGNNINYNESSTTTNPKFVLYNDLIYRKIKGKMMFNTSKICVLDGFVNVDVYFDYPL